MDEHARKTALYEQFARVGKALANPARLELLDLLAQGERSVEDLAGTAQMKVSNTSAQLHTLAAAGLVASRRDGVKVYYRLADPGVSALTGQVQDFAASRLAEAEHAARSYLGDVTALEPVGHYAVRILFDDGHDTGLYSWDWLHELGRDHGKKWAAYIKALGEKGLSRE